MNYREVTKKLSEEGCYFVREIDGSHKQWYSPITNRKFPVQQHKGKDIPTSTLRKIQKQSGVRLI